MKIIQPVSIMESEWFRYKALYDRLCKDMEILDNSITIGKWKAKYIKFLKAFRNHNSSEYLKQRIIYATFLEIYDKSNVSDTDILSAITEYVGILVNDTLNEIMSWSEE